MKLGQAIMDERIDDNTTVIINDMYGRPTLCGRWYEDKILVWGSFNVSFDYVEERNIAIFQLL